MRAAEKRAFRKPPVTAGRVGQCPKCKRRIELPCRACIAQAIVDARRVERLLRRRTT